MSKTKVHFGAVGPIGWSVTECGRGLTSDVTLEPTRVTCDSCIKRLAAKGAALSVFNDALKEVMEP